MTTPLGPPPGFTPGTPPPQAQSTSNPAPTQRPRPGPPNKPPIPSPEPFASSTLGAVTDLGNPGQPHRDNDPAPTKKMVGVQLFLDGWIMAQPGQGWMRLRMPDGSTSATVTLNAQSAADVPNITFSTAVETFPDGRAVAHITWFNTAASPVPVDYRVDAA